ncbi:hypothetical protein LTR66_010497 [Elasticomyces elasticus]|nr:hypothetical protein LTR66_010497 [Elasticomyces elasticus]
MTTPHRGLPPPAAMSLPDLGRPPPQLPQPLGSMPAPPNQWQGAEESMRNWLSAKAEEDRRKQEEERTHQESLRLEQRRIEQSMLRESMQGGVPPHMVPIIFAGIGGANLANVSMDWLQQYAAQLQVAQQQQIKQETAATASISTDPYHDSRLLSQAQPAYGAAAPSVQPQQVLQTASTIQSQSVAPNQQYQTTLPAYQTTDGADTGRLRFHNTAQAAPMSASRAPLHASLPRLTTNEMNVQPPPTGPSSAHPLQQSQTLMPEQPTSSPSIYFHHWVPPTSQTAESKPGHPQTPSGRTHEPRSAHPGSYRSEPDWTSSPKKRKATGAHQAQQAPPQSQSSSGPQYTSPSFSTTSSTSGRRSGHNRERDRSIPPTRELDRAAAGRPSAQQRDFPRPDSVAAADPQEDWKDGPPGWRELPPQARPASGFWHAGAPQSPSKREA